MELQTFQHGELRDSTDTIIQEGTYGKETAFVNAQNDGILDYIMNNFEVLYNSIGGGGTLNVDTLTASSITATTITGTASAAEQLTHTLTVGGVSWDGSTDTTVPEFTAAEVDDIWDSI